MARELGVDAVLQGIIEARPLACRWVLSSGPSSADQAGAFYRGPNLIWRYLASVRKRRSHTKWLLPIRPATLSWYSWVTPLSVNHASWFDLCATSFSSSRNPRSAVRETQILDNGKSELTRSCRPAAFLTQTVSLEDTTVKFEIWDTAGQGPYPSNQDPEHITTKKVPQPKSLLRPRLTTLCPLVFYCPTSRPQNATAVLHLCTTVVPLQQS
jgi:hypothetical protein